MALTKIQLPKTLRGNRSLESIFYNRHPSLRRISLNRFVSLRILATVLNLSEHSAKNYLIFSQSIHGFEHLNQIFIHPVGVLNRMRRQAKRQIINLLKSSPTA